MIRFLDVLFSFLGLILLLPFLLVIAFFIKLSSIGPVLYKQSRIGLDGAEFNVFKFRTMRLNSDKMGLITVGYRDPRITSVGYFLRKYKLDELPQLFNVLIGDMSIVGPRPEVPEYVKFYTNEQKRVLGIKPGITDYASIEYANENEILAFATDPNNTYINEVLPDKIKLNFKYLENKGLKEYFKIILLTFLKIISKKKELVK
jgi:lipopolysaccharide/colanic/teichoic acid biosynthesis glycosyltransferase